MRNLYITLTILFVLSVFILVATFFYLDKERRKTYYYTVELEDKPSGSLRVDRYVTEDKTIYKANVLLPFDPVLTESKVKLSLDKGYLLNEYREDAAGLGEKESRVLRNKEGVVSYAADYDSRFAYLRNMPIKKDAFIFKKDSLVTYLPIIENYDFGKGRVQGFNVLLYFDKSLPPMKMLITFTSIRDEYLKVDGRRIKCECLLVKARCLERITVWVSKADRSIVKVEMPGSNLRYTRVFSPKRLDVKTETIESTAYTSRSVSFKNDDAVLAGTLTVPVQKTPARPVLLIPDAGLYDRDFMGIFQQLADRLSKEGCATLRFDKRGVGASSGNFDSLSDQDEEKGIKAALEFLCAQKEVDANRLVLIGFSKGGYFASRVAARDDRVKGCIILAGLAFTTEESSNFQALKTAALRANWSEEYLKLAIKSKREAVEIVKSTDRSWRSFLGMRCYLKKMREELDERPLEEIAGVKVPVLLLHGNNDEKVPSDYSKLLDEALKASGNAAGKVIYFGYLGHYLGERKFDGRHRIVYEADAHLMDAITGWLKCGPLEAKEEEPAPAAEK